MSAIVTAITTALTPAVIMGAVADLVPLLIIIVPVSFGIHELRKAVKGISKGKTNF